MLLAAFLALLPMSVLLIFSVSALFMLALGFVPVSMTIFSCCLLLRRLNV
jgi:hypothetical protein